MSLVDAIRRIWKYEHKAAAVRYLVSHPELLTAVGKDRTPLHLFRSMQQFLGDDLLDGVHYFFSDEFLEALDRHGLRDQSGYRVLLYLLVRKYRPEVFVETGVAKGVGSAYILQGLEDNGRGTLHSIDLPPGESEIDRRDGENVRLVDGQVHDSYEPGHVIPSYLRERWEFHAGDARVLLPRLLDELGEIDVFFHDSLHTYEHMKFEFEAAWPHIRRGGLLISDDCTWNPAWEEFCRHHGVRSTIYRTTGLVVKP